MPKRCESCPRRIAKSNGTGPLNAFCKACQNGDKFENGTTTMARAMDDNW